MGVACKLRLAGVRPHLGIGHWTGHAMLQQLSGQEGPKRQVAPGMSQIYAIYNSLRANMPSL